MRIVGILAAAACLCFGNRASAAAACNDTTTPRMQAICADEAAERAYIALQSELAAALERLSPEGKAILEVSQERWVDRVSNTCIAFPLRLQQVIPDRNGDSVGCLRGEIDRRIEFLDTQGRRIGSHVWQQVDRADDLYCDTGKDERGINLTQLTWTWPRIDAPSSAATRKWNDDHKITEDDIDADRKDADPCDLGGYHNRGIALVFTEGDFVDLEYTEDWSGLNHGMYTVTSRLESITTGRKYQAEDFFEPGSGWQKLIAKRLFEASGSDETANPLAGFQRNSEEVERWSIGSKELTYSFGPYELGCYACAMQVQFTWKELRPYLRANLPFQPDYN